jgi:hypothetical protein
MEHLAAKEPYGLSHHNAIHHQKHHVFNTGTQE